MNVGELMALLATFPSDASVVVEMEIGDEDYSIRTETSHACSARLETAGLVKKWQQVVIY